MKRNVGIALVAIAAIAAIWVAVTRVDEKPKAEESGRKGVPVKEQLTASMKVTKVLSVDPQFEVFSELLKSTGQGEQLGDGPYTMFVPNSSSFTSLGEDELAKLRDDVDGSGTRAIRHHIVKGRMKLADLIALNGKTIETLDGAELSVEFKDNVLTIGGVKVDKFDIDTREAVVHVLGGVISTPATTP